MTTIVLAHPSESCPRFQVFGVHDGPEEHKVFALQEFAEQDDAERVAHAMMEVFEADHFRRVVCASQKIG